MHGLRFTASSSPVQEQLTATVLNVRYAVPAAATAEVGQASGSRR